MVGELLAAARGSLREVQRILSDEGLRFMELRDAPWGVGVAVAFGQADYVVISVMAGNEHVVYLTSGILRDVVGDRLTILNACNRFTRDNVATPFFLHDADAGSDLLVQQAVVRPLLQQAPGYLVALVRNLPAVAAEARPQLASGGISGSLYQWTEDDVARLLLRSTMA